MRDWPFRASKMWKYEKVKAVIWFHCKRRSNIQDRANLRSLVAPLRGAGGLFVYTCSPEVSVISKTRFLQVLGHQFHHIFNMFYRLRSKSRFENIFDAMWECIWHTFPEKCFRERGRFLARLLVFCSFFISGPKSKNGNPGSKNGSLVVKNGVLGVDFWQPF